MYIQNNFFSCSSFGQFKSQVLGTKPKRIEEDFFFLFLTLSTFGKLLSVSRNNAVPINCAVCLAEVPYSLFRCSDQLPSCIERITKAVETIFQR